MRGSCENQQGPKPLNPKPGASKGGGDYRSSGPSGALGNLGELGLGVLGSEGLGFRVDSTPA